MKAVLKNYRQSPRKVRLLADLVRGKKVKDALNTLKFVEKRASEPFCKVINSALANAVQKGANADTLKIAKVTVDQGITYKRSMPRARGSASRINKRNSHIVVELG
ncbi:MAG: large subunit ribosomal protein L22 [Candidatus Azotimanducaceae bacterium]|jgi:large subunit ribosomal protein L22